MRCPAPAPAAPQRRGGHDVVHVQSDADHAIGACPVEGGDDHGQRPDEVGGQVDHELPFQQGLADQPEIELLQVAQTTVNELGGAAARTGGEIRLFDQADAVAARRGVEGDPGAGDPAADDEDIEALALESLEGATASDHEASGYPGVTASGSGPCSLRSRIPITASVARRMPPVGLEPTV